MTKAQMTKEIQSLNQAALTKACADEHYAKVEANAKFPDVKFPDAKCRDCGTPYEFFPLDVVLPMDQWLMVNRDQSGVLCAKCIVERASKLPHIIVAHMTLEFA